MELREPAVYNSIFEAISCGASRLNEISQRVHEESYKCSKYVNTLRSIKLIEKVTPCGETESSKKSIYRITDHFYDFWYHFIFTNRSYYEMLGAEAASLEITEPENLSDYMDHIFEEICCQYMVRMAKKRKLPFIPYKMGKWWGNNPARKAQDDMDILALDRSGMSAIFCECKFRNTVFDKTEYEDLMSAAAIFTQPANRCYFIFSKGGYSDWVREAAQRQGDVHLLGIDDLFDDSL